METRMIMQCRIYVLVLNTFGRAEDGAIVAVSSDYDRLVQWYKKQFADERYVENGWHKTFKKGSPIEFNNPCNTLELNNNHPFGHGIHDEWVNEDFLRDHIMNHYNWIG